MDNLSDKFKEENDWNQWGLAECRTVVLRIERMMMMEVSNHR
jgi:hypothetical protein